jgi:hypothetical protein
VSRFLLKFYFSDEIYCLILGFYRTIIVISNNAILLGVDIFECLIIFYSGKIYFNLDIKIVLLFALISGVASKGRRFIYNESLQQ